jgi:hypothetical protein
MNLKKAITSGTITLDPVKQVLRLKALAVDDAGSGLVVLLLRDPHLLERRQRREDRAADPHRVLALRWRVDPTGE